MSPFTHGAAPHMVLAFLLATSPDESVRDGAEALKLAREVVQATKTPQPATWASTLMWSSNTCAGVWAGVGGDACRWKSRKRLKVWYSNLLAS